MNKKVLTVIILTIVAIMILYLYSFGPLANRRHAVRLNPASLKPTTRQISSHVINVYHNKDSKENFYRIAFPQNWQVKAGTAAGSYHFSFNGGVGSVELVDVPDNSTLELFILSREEPRLKKNVSGYERKSYKKITINGYDTYQLEYSSILKGYRYENIRTYITGQDMAGVVTITMPEKASASFAKTVNAVITSFKWEN
ncbi:MAG: hypothetical protein NT066_07610 [Candidatus Omnitrophica bacterium]|nr:hypothetical protein [Candidatus Omnitrophota bacterium]